MVVIFAFGSCYNNGQERAHAGAGACFKGYPKLDISERLLGPQTSQRAPLVATNLAVQRALASPARFVTVKTNAEYVVDGFNKYREEWQNNNYTACTGKKVDNWADFKQLFALGDQVRARGGILRIVLFRPQAGRPDQRPTHDDTLFRLARTLARAGAKLPPNLNNVCSNCDCGQLAPGSSIGRCCFQNPVS